VSCNGSKNTYLYGVIPLENLTLVDLVKKFTVFYVTLKVYHQACKGQLLVPRIDQNRKKYITVGTMATLHSAFSSSSL